MKRLFQEDAGEIYNEDGCAFSMEVRTALEPILERYAHNGFSLIESQLIIQALTQMLVSRYKAEILFANMKLSRLQQ